ADRPIEQRQDVFLIGADVADIDGISEVEHKALDEIAGARQVDKSALLR
ncbi:Tellurite resistance protein TerB, partial [Methylobacterium sp. D54C]